jgi:DNA-binding NarL/FixJ family response regulator
MPIDLEPGTVFAGHRLEEVAGRGGMGVVFRATDLALDRRVALKVIAPALADDPIFRVRFERECRSAAALDHPSVVQVFHAGEEDGLLYVTMRFIEGTDLSSLLAAEHRLAADRAVRLLTDVAAALDAAHAHDLVHRDVKPGNVLIAGDRAFLTDFGVTKQRAVDMELTQPGFVMGTADYIAPEQANGQEVDGRADAYSLACVLFQALTGSVPYQGESPLDKLYAHAHADIPSPLDHDPSLPSGLGPVLRRGMAKDPGDRFPAAMRSPALRESDGRLRVVVADDSMLLREGVVRLLADAGFEVVGQASDGDELVRTARVHRPDVVVTDIRMPPTHSDEGVRAARTVRAEMPGTGVLVLSQHVEERYAQELLDGGTDGIGYLLKDRVIDPTAFAEAVRRVAAGGAALDPDVVDQMLSRHGEVGRLSRDEREVLAAIAQGRSERAIAERLHVDEADAHQRVTDVLCKLALPAAPEERGRRAAVLQFLCA